MQHRNVFNCTYLMELIRGKKSSKNSSVISLNFILFFYSGIVENEYMNEVFSAGDLVHGTRYIVCVHADYKEIDRDTWVEVLAAVSTCSDGVVVDLTSPTAGAVWISHSPSVRYQVLLVCCLYNSAQMFIKLHTAAL